MQHEKQHNYIKGRGLVLPFKRRRLGLVLLPLSLPGPLGDRGKPQQGGPDGDRGGGLYILHKEPF